MSSKPKTAEFQAASAQLTNEETRAKSRTAKEPKSKDEKKSGSDAEIAAGE